MEGYTTAKQSESTCGGVHYGITVRIDTWRGTLRPNGQNRHVEGYTTARQLCVNAPTTAHVQGYTAAKQSESTCGGVHYGQTVRIYMWRGILRHNGQNRHVEGYSTAKRSESSCMRERTNDLSLNPKPLTLNP